MSKNKPKVEFALVCDDVRREDNGKLMVLGLYASNMRFSSFPANISFNVLLGVQSTSSDTFKFAMRIFKDGEKILDGNGEASFETPGLGLFPISGIAVQFTEPTEIEIKIKLGDGRFQSVRKLEIAGPPD